jgi:hypothetical protein
MGKIFVSKFFSSLLYAKKSVKLSKKNYEGSNIPWNDGNILQNRLGKN